MNMLVSASAVASATLASPASAHDADAELIRLGRLFDVAAAELARAQRRNSEAYDEAERMAPVPKCLLIKPSDADNGIPVPRYEKARNYCYDLDVTAARKVDHPRARQVVAAYKKWHDDFRHALQICDYQDDHPDILAANEALQPIEDAIEVLPAQTLAGLQVKARLAFNCCVGAIADNDSDPTDERVRKSIIRDLMRLQGIVGIETDFEFVKQDPFGKLVAAA